MKVKRESPVNKLGQQHGLCVGIYGNGNGKSMPMHRLNYVDGKKEGLQRWYHSNGKLDWIGDCKNGVEDGIQRLWSKEGKMRCKVAYKNGRRFGEYIWNIKPWFLSNWGANTI